MKEPTRYSMKTGKPVEPKIKLYPLKSINQSIEKEFFKFIEKQKEENKIWKKA